MPCLPLRKSQLLKQLIGIRKKMVHSIKQRVLYLLLIPFARFAERNYQKENNSNL
nr:MAG TPA: hypothetical protein [Caudoviricetes sp.]